MLGRNPWRRGRFLAFGHLDYPIVRFHEKLRNQLRFRQRGPMPYRHLGFHRFYFDASRIENRTIVFAPQFLERISLGRFRAQSARRIRNFLAIPMRAAVRSQNRPAQARKAFRKPWRNGLDDVMIRSMPSYELLRLTARYTAKAHKRLHFVNVPMNGPFEQVKLPYIIVCCDFQKIMFAMRDAI